MWVLHKANFSCLAVAGLLLIPLPAQGQFVVSSRAGLISYTDGQVALLNPSEDDDPRELTDHVGEGGRLSTEDGRAEMILTPGGMLRLDKFSELELLSNDITDVQVRILSGSVILDLWKQAKRHSIALFVKRGRYRVDVGFDGTAELSVLRGKTIVSLGDVERDVGTKHRIRLTADLPGSEIQGAPHGTFDGWDRKRAHFLSELRRRGEKLAVGARGAPTAPVGIPGVTPPSRQVPANNNPLR